jgi:hypothetical protein
MLDFHEKKHMPQQLYIIVTNDFSFEENIPPGIISMKQKHYNLIFKFPSLITF